MKKRYAILPPEDLAQLGAEDAAFLQMVMEGGNPILDPTWQRVRRILAPLISDVDFCDALEKTWQRRRIADVPARTPRIADRPAARKRAVR